MNDFEKVFNSIKEAFKKSEEAKDADQAKRFAITGIRRYTKLKKQLLSGGISKSEADALEGVKHLVHEAIDRI